MDIKKSTYLRTYLSNLLEFIRKNNKERKNFIMDINNQSYK